MVIIVTVVHRLGTGSCGENGPPLLGRRSGGVGGGLQCYLQGRHRLVELGDLHWAAQHGGDGMELAQQQATPSSKRRSTELPSTTDDYSRQVLQRLLRRHDPGSYLCCRRCLGLGRSSR